MPRSAMRHPADMDGSSSSDDEWEIIPTSTPSKPKSKAVRIEVTVPAGTSSTSPKPSIMPGWKDEYLSSLLEAEKNSPVNQDLVEACSQLNDRIAALEAEKAHWQTSSNPPPEPSPQPQPPTSSSTTSTSDQPPPPNPSDPQALTRLRADLAEALRQRSSLETRLRRVTSERDALLAAGRTAARAARELAQERDSLRTRVRDQSEELRGKKQMLEQVQDEVLALDLQLNVAEQQKARIAAENKQLIERWMRRARQEADDMNAANERRD
ncbi:hypothetical protein VPNG_09458 [Cytospora leucostoma]|uniref:Autophagy-related protein 16 domain-containing protein n=1 Tax=Cytospora leucostoma TaxID=1230097 RepID=A0A423VVE5_9PEZI|nr:hypothetical protein VPNG_09458 [Cytospora leucostoma]